MDFFPSHKPRVDTLPVVIRGNIGLLQNILQFDQVVCVPGGPNIHFYAICQTDA